MYLKIFYIIYFRDTYIEREPGETKNDRNDRAIRTAVKWYDNHLNCDDYHIQIVLLTDDVQNRKHAAEDGIFVTSSKICFILI